jgi:hypothetical protein
MLRDRKSFRPDGEGPALDNRSKGGGRGIANFRHDGGLFFYAPALQKLIFQSEGWHPAVNVGDRLISGS